MIPIRAKKPSKYRSKKVEYGGEKFDSKRELQRWLELRLMLRAGQISDLRRQVPFELIPKQKDPDGKAVRAVSYVADFVYTQNGRQVVEDAKGARTRDYIIKRKLMLSVHGIWVRES